MTSSLSSSATTTMDPAYIAEIVRRVLARVRATSTPIQATNPSPLADTIKLVTVETVIACAASNSRVLRINRKSIVTPAARDEANRLGVQWEMAGTNKLASLRPASLHQASGASLGMIDTTGASWVESIIATLARRGIAVSSGYSAIQIILTDCPAKQTHNYSSLGKHRAAMLTGLNQVERFHRELSPDVWVIDKTQVGLPTIVNIVAAISRLEGAIS